jgi:hypothetical protein
LIERAEILDGVLIKYCKDFKKNYLSIHAVRTANNEEYVRNKKDFSG